MDVALKLGPDWEREIKAFGVDQEDELNDNANIVRNLEDLKSANPNIHTYFTALRHSISHIKTIVKEIGKWTIVIYLIEEGTISYQLNSFKTGPSLNFRD